MNSKLSSRISTVFYVVFSFCFFSIFLNVILNNPWYDVSQPIAVFCMLLDSALLFFAFKLTARHRAFLQKNAFPLVASVLLVVFGIQLLVGYWFRITPAFDVEAIYKGAIAWNRTGSPGDFMVYFCRFPNNLGGLFVLGFVFRIADLLHYNDYNGMAVIWNALMINLSFLLVYATCRKLFGTVRGIAALFFSVCCLPLIFYTPVFYTDTLSLCFPILGYYLYLQAKSAKSKMTRTLWFVLIGIVFSLGMWIKMTVIIMLVAIIMDILLTCRIRRYILPVGCALIVVAVGCAGFTAIRSRVLDQKTYQEKNLPYSHWIMMGLKGVGTYSAGDYNYTYSFPTVAEKQAGIQKEIKARMEAYTPFSFLCHLSNKTTYIFGSGQYGADTMLDDNPPRKNWFHAYVIYTDQTNETRFKAFNSCVQGYHLLLLSLITASSFAALKHRKSRNFRCIAPKIAVAGLILFLMIWEASSRYLVNYLPVMIVCAFSGLDLWSRHIENMGKRLVRRGRKPAAHRSARHTPFCSE